MSILYKTARNVRFVLFRKKSNGFLLTFVFIAEVLHNHMAYDYFYTQCMYSNQTIMMGSNRAVTVQIHGGKYYEV